MILKKETVDVCFSYAKRIRELRKDFSLTQKEAGFLVNVTQRTYSSYELRNIRMPVDSLIALARYYDTDMNYICGVSRKKAPFPKE